MKKKEKVDEYCLRVVSCVENLGSPPGTFEQLVQKFGDTIYLCESEGVRIVTRPICPNLTWTDRKVAAKEIMRIHLEKMNASDAKGVL